jgi:hypothetical protein
MSRLIARILLCMLMFPIAVVCFCAAAMTMDRIFNSIYSLLYSAGLVTWAFIAVYWTLVWRKSVRWTLWRILVPLIAALIGLAVGAVSPFALYRSGNREDHILLLSILIPSLWLVATVLAWRESPAERATRLGASGRANVSCPTCGYNLTGLTEARCPECGTKFTLDELLAAQPGRASGEMD